MFNANQPVSEATTVAGLFSRAASRKEHMNKNQVIVGGIVGGVVLIGLCCGVGGVCLIVPQLAKQQADRKNDDGNFDQSKNATDKKGIPAKVEIAKIGDEVLLSDSKWLVLKAEDKGNTLMAVSRFSKDATTTGKFVLVHFKVTNLSNKEVQIDKAVLVDSQGREFSTFGDQYKYLPKEAKKLDIFNPLPASVPKEFYGIYEVPADANGLRFRARDMRPFDSREYKLVELGF